MYYVKKFRKMDKIDRLLDSIEHPERYSEPEIASMLADPEVREVYDLLSKTKSTMSPVPTPDIDAEWATFSKVRKGRKFGILSLFTRNVAASIAIAIASLAAVAAVVGVSAHYAGKKEAATAESPAASIEVKAPAAPDAEVVSGIEEIPAPEPVIFDNETLETVIAQLAGHYGCQVRFASESAKSLRLHFRWDKSMTLDQVVSDLNNFEQIHISVSGQTIQID